MSEITSLPPQTVKRGLAQVDNLVVDRERLDLLAELDQVNGFTDALVIYDKEFGDALEAAGLAKKSNKGSYYPTEKFSAWLEVHQLLIIRAIIASENKE